MTSLQFKINKVHLSKLMKGNPLKHQFCQMLSDYIRFCNCCALNNLLNMWQHTNTLTNTHVIIVKMFLNDINNFCKLQFFSIAKTLKPIGWTKFAVAWTHLANCAVCCQYLKPFHMVKHNLQISLRLFSRTLNTFSFSKHILHSNAHVIHTGKHNWQSNTKKRTHVID